VFEAIKHRHDKKEEVQGWTTKHKEEVQKCLEDLFKQKKFPLSQPQYWSSSPKMKNNGNNHNMS